MKGLLAVIAAVVMSLPALAQDSGWIGVSVAEQSDRGALVRNVEANSPAERAGIRANDVIVQFNKQEVVGVLQLTRLVSDTLALTEPLYPSTELTEARLRFSQPCPVWNR